MIVTKSAFGDVLKHGGDICTCSPITELLETVLSLQCAPLGLCQVCQLIIRVGRLAYEGGRTQFLIPVFRSPFSLKPLILWSPKLAASKLTTQTLVF